MATVLETKLNEGKNPDMHNGVGEGHAGKKIDARRCPPST